MAKEKKLSLEEIRQQIQFLTDKEQIQMLADLQKLADEKEAERKSLSSEYQKVNGKQ